MQNGVLPVVLENSSLSRIQIDSVIVVLFQIEELLLIASDESIQRTFIGKATTLHFESSDAFIDCGGQDCNCWAVLLEIACWERLENKTLCEIREISLNFRRNKGLSIDSLWSFPLGES